MTCNSYQNWRRHVDLSSNILSLLVALISVSGIVIPLLAKSCHEERSNVRVALVRQGDIEAHAGSGWSNGEAVGHEGIDYVLPVTLLLSNTGDRPGAVVPVSLTLRGAQGVLADGVGREQVTVEPKAYRLETFVLPIRVRDRSVLPPSFTVKRDAEFDHRVKVSSAVLVLKLLAHDASEREVKVDLRAGEFPVRLK